MEQGKRNELKRRIMAELSIETLEMLFDHVAHDLCDLFDDQICDDEGYEYNPNIIMDIYLTLIEKRVIYGEISDEGCIRRVVDREQAEALKFGLESVCA